MKILLLILSLIPTITFSQKDSVGIRDHLYFDLNLGTGSIKYNYYYSSFQGVNYSTNMKNNSICLSASFYYKNQRWKAGLKTGSIFVFKYNKSNQYLSIETGLNVLPKPKFNNYFGPSLSFGFFRQYPESIFGKRFIEIGLESYFENFHLGLKYQFLERGNEKYINSINTTHLYIELGYVINNKTFRKKK